MPARLGNNPLLNIRVLIEHAESEYVAYCLDLQVELRCGSLPELKQTITATIETKLFHVARQRQVSNLFVLAVPVSLWNRWIRATLKNGQEVVLLRGEASAEIVFAIAS
ncbi:MAG TPA: hypothetical protein VN622_10525 [Clostridia bacterium]|nr:hypothetical protein [Clostridia bacterium]